MSERYTTLVNLKTKKAIFIDQKKVRLHRMQRRIRHLATILNTQEVQKNFYLVMLTLTYAPGKEWEAGHIREFMLGLRKYAGNALLGYAWVAELQERGAVHYHVMCWFHKGFFVACPDKNGLWTHGMTRRETVRTPFYLTKYTGKEKQKDFDKFPKGIRVFSVWVSDVALKTDLRFMSLKLWEQQYVLSDGWESLSFWRKFEKSQSGWIAWGFRGSEEEAIEDIRQWEAVFALGA